MTEGNATIIIVAAIAALPTTLASLLALFKISSVHKEINSRMTELLELTRKASHAEGVKEGSGNIVRVDTGLPAAE